MDNRNFPDGYYNYGEYNGYQNYRLGAASGNENLLPRESLLKASDENKPYYRSQENFQNSYPDDQLWNMQTRRVPNSSYSMFSPSFKQNVNQSVMNSQIRDNLAQKRDLPLKGILVGGHNGNNMEGIHRSINPDEGMIQERKETNHLRAKSPHTNYRLQARTRSNENLLGTLCGGEPVLDMDDNQYYLINERKLGPENYDNKNLYDDYNDQTDDEISFKDGNIYDYNSVDSEIYESPLDMAKFDPRERPNKPFQNQIYCNNHCEKSDGSTYDNSDNSYYMLQQPSSSQGFSQSRLNLNRSRHLIHPHISRREMYKQLASEKLNETFNELKNAGLSDNNEKYNPQRNESFSGMDRYKYQDLLNENGKRLGMMMPHLNKYKVSNDNEEINRRLHFPLIKTQDASCNTNRNIQMGSEEQKFKNSLGESGSFVHMQ
ncbi:uncharacterized protein [Halyomorpha halys]|uniref:uncharacterized protein isoform X2 n=1 Tax=Halyomorpha halys TaxID=286706 RepID=UPI0034D22240